MKKTICAIAVFAFAAAAASTCRAQSSGPIPVKAVIEQQSGLTVAISRVVGTTWSTDTEINFGTLTLDPVYQIFKSNRYYAIDVGVNTNAANWTITHAASSVAGPSDHLNYNINVTFVRQISNSSDAALSGGKVSYAASNGKQYTKSDFSAGGWLRIYYGLGTGSGDNNGVTPIFSNKAPGTYSGSVTLTLITSG